MLDCWKSIQAKLWAGYPRRFRWRSLGAAREKRRGGFWKRSRGGRRRITTQSRYRRLLWRLAKKNLGRSTWLASWGTNSHIWKDYMLSPKGGDHRIICLCFSWEARLAISIAMKAILQTGDALLLGTDLEKNVELQLLAYDDPAGVTAAFNLNLLARINRELGADFDLKCFRHEARWNRVERRIEMHLRSTRRQTVHVPAASLRLMLDEDETIWTESSHKYQAEEISKMAARTGFRCDGQWIDQEWPFAQNLLIAG